MKDNKKYSLGDRIKSSYEDPYRVNLSKRLPVILRLDGCHFHSYTRECKKPVDMDLIDCMNETAKYLCANIQGCQIAYVQSDEISLLLNNYKTFETQAWFDNNLQKMVSVSAAMASAIFTAESWRIWGFNDYYNTNPIIKPAMFDCRAFIVPKEDVSNVFLWRQQDADFSKAWSMYYKNKDNRTFRVDRRQ